MVVRSQPKSACRDTFQNLLTEPPCFVDNEDYKKRTCGVEFRVDRQVESHALISEHRSAVRETCCLPDSKLQSKRSSMSLRVPRGGFRLTSVVYGACKAIAYFATVLNASTSCRSKGCPSATHGCKNYTSSYGCCSRLQIVVETQVQQFQG